MTKTACGFCQSTTAKITNEHIFGEWLNDVFGVGEGRLKMRHSLHRHDTDLRREWTNAGLDQQVRMPCKPCNNGWMSGIESAAIDVLMPMIKGHERRVLSVRDRAAVALWAVKTLMVSEFVNKEPARYFTQEERTALKDDRSTFRRLGVYVWLGRYVDKNDGIIASHATGALVPGVPSAHMSVIALGKLVIHVLVQRGLTELMLPKPFRSGPWDQLLALAWPLINFDSATFLIWPPRRGIHARDFERIFDRFVVSGGYGTLGGR